MNLIDRVAKLEDEIIRLNKKIDNLRKLIGFDIDDSDEEDDDSPLKIKKPPIIYVVRAVHKGSKKAVYLNRDGSGMGPGGLWFKDFRRAERFGDKTFAWEFCDGPDAVRPPTGYECPKPIAYEEDSWDDEDEE